MKVIQINTVLDGENVMLTALTDEGKIFTRWIGQRGGWTEISQPQGCGMSKFDQFTKDLEARQVPNHPDEFVGLENLGMTCEEYQSRIRQAATHEYQDLLTIHQGINNGSDA